MTILGSGSVQITISPRTAHAIVGITQTGHIRFIASIQKKIKKSCKKIWRIEKLAVSLQ
jgi:hypothetical protein